MSDIELHRASEAESGYGIQQSSGPRHVNIFQVAWRGRWIILLCVALALAGGVFYLTKQTPIYASTSRVYVEASQYRMTDSFMQQQNSMNYLPTQCQLIESARILGPVAEMPEFRTMKTFKDVDNPIGLLQRDLAALTTKFDDLITVTFESPYPADAAAVVNAVVASYQSYHESQRRTGAADALRLLTKEKAQFDAELRAKLRDMLEFKKAHPEFASAGDGVHNVIQQELARTSEALSTASTEAGDAQGAYEGARQMSGDPGRMAQWMRLQSPGGASEYSGEIARMQVELKRKMLSLGAGHAEVKSLQLQISEIKDIADAETQTNFALYLSALDQRRAGSKGREAELLQKYNELKAKAATLNEQGTEYAAMESEARQLERSSETLDNKIKDVRLAEEDGPKITVFEAARPGVFPVKPRKALVMFQALMIGLVIGGGLAQLRELMDHRLRTAEEVRSLLGLNVLGTVPQMGGKETASVRGQKVQLDPMSDVAEAYRTIRTAIYFGAPEDKARTLLVTSGSPGDGKSTSASNLAIAMAQAGQRVLLLDADFRKPSQHRIFDLDNTVGVTTVVSAKTPLSKAVKTTSVPGLYVLPSGPIPQNPAEILNSQLFKQVIEKLGTKFDHIIIDSPPVAPVTDARILGALCDLTIFVVRANKSTRKVSIASRESLLSVGTQILGVVVNGIRQGGAYGYHGYGYGYYRTPAPRAGRGGGKELAGAGSDGENGTPVLAAPNNAD